MKLFVLWCGTCALSSGVKKSTLKINPYKATSSFHVCVFGMSVVVVHLRSVEKNCKNGREAVEKQKKQDAKEREAERLRLEEQKRLREQDRDRQRRK